MRVWRALKAHGAAILRDGVHLLPAGEVSERILGQQADHIEEAGGSAHVISFSAGEIGRAHV